ncbi:hypothetical protein KAR91_56950 [Candidatus Pacearchaeota archaeon]|nr:hypothetical protein [Candidatus Pacearchaeota archaeon]
MSHTTKYGNTYTDKEWTEMQDYYAQEKDNDDVISKKMLGLEKYLRRQLRENVGITTKQQANTVVRLFRYGEWEEANIQFSSQERQDKLNNLWQRWSTAMDKVSNEAQNLADDLEISRLKIMENE